MSTITSAVMLEIRGKTEWCWPGVNPDSPANEGSETMRYLKKSSRLRSLKWMF